MLFLFVQEFLNGFESWIRSSQNALGSLPGRV